MVYLFSESVCYLYYVEYTKLILRVIVTSTMTEYTKLITPRVIVTSTMAEYCKAQAPSPSDPDHGRVH